MRKIALGGIIVSVMAMMAGNADAVTLASKGYVDSAIETVESELASKQNTLIAGDDGNISASNGVTVTATGNGSVAVAGVTADTTTAGVVKYDGTSVVTNTNGQLSVGTISAANIEVPATCTAASHLCVLTWKTNKEGGAGWVLVDITDAPAKDSDM